MFLKDKSGKVDVKGMIKKIVTNPLNIGVAIGLVVLAIRSFIPLNADGQLAFSLKDSLPLVYKTVNNVSQICSPLALIILGGLFEFSAIKGMKKPIIIGTAARIFTAIAKNNINIRMIDQGSGEFNIIISVADKDMIRTVNAIYHEFEMD